MMIATKEKTTGHFAPILIPGLERRPDFWPVRVDEIDERCRTVRRGQSKVIARTPGGFPVYALFYGDFSEPPPQSNYSAAASSDDLRSYYRRHDARQTFVWCAGIHGAEPEGVAFAMNLIELLETGRDLLGREHPALPELLTHYRLIVLPCVNMDGRAISPDHLRGASYEDFRRASQGYWPDGTLIGWRGSKEYFPLPLDQVAYPGGYPNGEGFNIMHDACPGHLRTAEARAILRLTERHRVDFLLNCHSCEHQPVMLPPSEFEGAERVARGLALAAEVNDALYRTGLRAEPAPPRAAAPVSNLNNLVTLASGALALTLECSVCHGRSFEEQLEVGFVAFRTLLEAGRRRPFVRRPGDPKK